VSPHATPQLFSGANLQHDLHRNSTRQHQQFIFRRFVHTPFSRRYYLLHIGTDWVYVHMDLNPVVSPLLDPPTPHTGIQHKPRSTALASSSPGIVHMSKISKLFFRRNADTPALNRTGTGGSVCSRHVNSTSLIPITDASNFQNSTFWDPDTTSGVGGWGDSNDDDQITDGAFADDFIVSYPSPHRLRRRYTPNNPNNPDELLTTVFTPESQAAMVNGFQGDFIGFQARFAPGSHAAVHDIVGGCVNLPNALRLCPLTDPTQRPFWKLSVDRSCRLHRRPQVVPQWWVPD